jgi:hypothetical protein
VQLTESVDEKEMSLISNFEVRKYKYIGESPSVEYTVGGMKQCKFSIGDSIQKRATPYCGELSPVRPSTLIRDDDIDSSVRDSGRAMM